MNQGIEHLFLDVTALEEVHRILAPGGVLVLTLPYISHIQDRPEYHVRVHTPKTIRRLLERCGFTIEEHFVRGLCSRLAQFPASRGIVYLGHNVVQVFLRREPERAVRVVNSALLAFESFLGSGGLARTQRMFASYGGIIKAVRVATKRDFHSVQVAV
jgi:SAM-dependent methyltransferase